MTRLLALLPLALACAEVEAPLLPDDALPPPGALALRVSAITPGARVQATASGAVPGSDVTLLLSRHPGPGPCVRGVCLDLASPRVIATTTADRRGLASFSGLAPATLPPGATLYFQAASVDGTPASTSPVVAITLGGGTCPTVDPNDRYYARFEGLGADNACRTDADCVVGGCSAEVCAAEVVATTCELLPYLPEGSCGCVQNTCVWSDVCP